MANKMKKRTRRGAAIVEMAVVTPLLLLLTFGIMEYGWMFLKAGIISDAARHGARYAVLPDVTSVEQVASPGYDPLPSAVNILTEGGISVHSQTVTVPTGVTPGTGNPVTVVVTVPYEDIKLFGFFLLPTPQNLRSSVTMFKEGL